MGGTAPRDGLRVLGISPGPVETDRMTARLRREAQAQFGNAERWRELPKGMSFGRAATPRPLMRSPGWRRYWHRTNRPTLPARSLPSMAAAQPQRVGQYSVRWGVRHGIGIARKEGAGD